MAIKTVLFIFQQTPVSMVLAKSGTEVPYKFPVAWLTLCESAELLILLLIDTVWFWSGP